MNALTLSAVTVALTKQYEKLEKDFRDLQKKEAKVENKSSNNPRWSYLQGKRTAILDGKTALWKAMNEVRVAAGLEPTKFFNTNHVSA